MNQVAFNTLFHIPLLLKFHFGDAKWSSGSEHTACCASECKSHLKSIHSFSETYSLHNLQICDLYDVLNLHIIYILFVIHGKESVCGIYPFHQGGPRYSETLKRT